MVLLAILSVMTATPASVRCDETRRVVPHEVKRGAADLSRDLAKRGLRVADLPSEGKTAHRLMQAQIRMRAWCGADEQLRIVQKSLEHAGARGSGAIQESGASAFAAGEELPDKEVAAGCPGKGRALASVLADLGAKLDQAQVRAFEVRRGPGLALQLEQAIRLRDTPRAIKTACVLTYRAGQLSDGLDRVMARFQRVNVLRDQHGLPEVHRARFDALVNEASGHLAARDYGVACGTLETLLVLLGEPVRPSDSLPRP